MKKPDFGSKLIEVRKAKGLTQEDVAEKCNISVRTIQRIESGIVKPRAFTIKIISEALGFDFFEASNTGNEAEHENQDTALKSHTILWLLKDLFNFKTNAMKKIYILSATFLMFGVLVFFLISESNAQTRNKASNSSLTIVRNKDNAVQKIEARFTNDLTFDSLVNIKNLLKSNGVNINYKKLVFDATNHLSAIECEVKSADGNGGGFSSDEISSTQDSKRDIGFIIDYTRNSKLPFCTGSCWYEK